MSDDMIIADASEGGATRRRLLTSMGAAAAGGGLLALAGTQTAQATVADGSYYSYGPVRWADTRLNSGGRIYGGQTRTLPIFSYPDLTFAINLTVVSTQGSGWLAVYNADLANRPNPYSSINWQGAGRIVANFSMLDTGAAGAKVYCSGSSSTNTHFIIDVVGYFVSGGAAAKAPPKEQARQAEMRRRLERQQSR